MDHPFAVDDLQFAQDGVGADVVIVVSGGDRVGRAGHLGGEVADVHRHVRDRFALLQHGVATLQVLHPVAGVVEPGRVSMKGSTEPRVLARHAVPGLMSTDVQHKMVDPLAEELLAARFEDVGMVAEVESAGEGLGIDPVFAVDMAGGARGPAFNGAQRPVGRPELAADLVRVGAVDRELPGESPVPVVLAPE